MSGFRAVSDREGQLFSQHQGGYALLAANTSPNWNLPQPEMIWEKQ